MREFSAKIAGLSDDSVWRKAASKEPRMAVNQEEISRTLNRM